MRLLESQKLELRNYIFKEQKYRETYNEIYDHLINALTDSNEPFTINKAARFINDDFGGFVNIKSKEKIYQKEINKKYILAFRMEILKSFKWPEILNNIVLLALCLTLYFGAKNQKFNLQPMMGSILACFLIVAITGYYRIFIGRLKYLKYSIFDKYIAKICSLGIVFITFLYFLIVKEGIFDLKDNAKLIFSLTIFYFGGIYVRSFFRFYTQRIKILIA